MGAPKGHKKYGGGRAKGTPNKVTASVKAALVEAFDLMGGVESLVEWGKKNRTEFYKLWGRLVPVEVKNADGESFEVTVTEVVVRSREEASAMLQLSEKADAVK